MELYLVEILLSAMSLSALLIIAIVLLRISKLYRTSINWKVKTYTQDVLERNKDQTLELRLFERGGIDDASDLNDEDRHILINVLNYYELLAQGIRRGMYDEEVVKDNYEPRMMHTFMMYREVIERLRYDTRSDRLYSEFEYLIKRWRSEVPSERFKHSLNATREGM